MKEEVDNDCELGTCDHPSHCKVCGAGLETPDGGLCEACQKEGCKP